MGKQIRGKPINPNGQLGKKLIATANEAFENWHLESKNKSKKEYSRATYIIAWTIAGICVLFMLRTC